MQSGDKWSYHPLDGVFLYIINNDLKWPKIRPLSHPFVRICVIIVSGPIFSAFGILETKFRTSFTGL